MARKIKFTNHYKLQISNILRFKRDWSVESARNFSDNLNLAIKNIDIFPYANRKSLYFDDDNIRDFIYKEYVITYKIFSDEIKNFRNLQREFTKS